METLAEFLIDQKNQEVVLEKIIEALREKGEWGQYGLFSKIGEAISFSASYVSKSLMKKKPLRENFVVKMAEYLGVHHSWLQGEFAYDYETAREMYQGLWLSSGSEEEKRKFIEGQKKKIEVGFEKYRELVLAFARIPFKERDGALKILQGIQQREKDKFNQPSEGE